MKVIIKVKNVFDDFVKTIITNISGSLGRKVRYWYYKHKFKRCGKNVIIDEGVIIQNPEWISIGDNAWIDRYVVLIAGAPDIDNSSRVFTIKENKAYKFERGELIIDDNVHIAPFCTIQAHGGVYLGKNITIASGSRIYSLSHHYRNLNDRDDRYEYKFSSMAPKNEQSLISSPVYIGNNCAIGLNSVVLPGTIINDGTWVGVSSYVSGELEGGAVYASEKAKFIKKKFE